MTKQQQKFTFTFLAFVCLCVAIRAVLWFYCDPMTTLDTPSYISVAKRFVSGDFKLGYLACRTPVYPLIILICRMNHAHIFLVQMFIGVLTSMLLFSLAWQQTKSLPISFLVGISYSLNLRLLFFEAYILTETFSTFTIVLFVWLILKSIKTNTSVATSIMCGISVALAALTRPLLLFLIPLAFIIFVVRQYNYGTKEGLAKWSPVMLFLVTACIPVFMWSAFNQAQIGYFGPTALTGYNLTQHSGGFIEKAPGRYEIITKVYIKHRENIIKESGTHIHTIWHAWPEMIKETGMSFAELSRELTRMSAGLFIRHPVLYAKSVSCAWWRFWQEDTFWDLTKVEPQFAARISLVWKWERIGMIGVSILFMSLSLGMCVVAIKKMIFPLSPIVFSALVILLASILQAMVEYGDNSRYAIPFQPLVLFVVITGGWELVQNMLKYRK